MQAHRRLAKALALGALILLFTLPRLAGAERLNMHGSKPTLSACGTSPSVVTGNDLAGYFTTGSGVVTSCVLTFTNTKNAPMCVFTVGSGVAVPFVSSISTTAVTIGLTITLPSTKIAYICWDN